MKLSLLIGVFFVGLFSTIRAYDDCDDDSYSSSSSDSDEHHGGGGGGHGGNGGNGGNGRYKRPNQGCGNGWIGLNRRNGRWCVKVFGGAMDQELAEDKCGSYQATLTAFMNSEEQKLINDDALRAISQSTGSIWIGAKRTSPCIGQGLTASCTPENSFYWTDGSTTGTAGFVWDHSQLQPDNAHGRTQNCAIYFAAPTSGQSLKHGKYFWLTQRMDDVWCSLGPNPDGPRKILGYVCGRKAE